MINYPLTKEFVTKEYAELFSVEAAPLNDEERENDPEERSAENGN